MTTGTRVPSSARALASAGFRGWVPALIAISPSPEGAWPATSACGAVRAADQGLPTAAGPSESRAGKTRSTTAPGKPGDQVVPEAARLGQGRAAAAPPGVHGEPLVGHDHDGRGGVPLRPPRR
ncbi:hypothetical protein [Microbispora sp. GKU 823]|uniref:hypothetical protein n=1 Tax=Microbispora sp. GKU 823 TaxID=1652100 RepID=UPI0011812D65|nr:hypothetical protein [Microbispora sp. GKU 823]